MPRFRNIFLSAFITGVVVLTAASLWLYREVTVAGPLPVEKLIFIEPGSSVNAVAADLMQAGAIDDETAFQIAARLCNRRDSLKAGEYNVPGGASIADLITLLQSGKTFQRKITIPEGLTVAEIVMLLQQEPALAGAVSALPPEGSLLPETYHFSYGDTRQSIINRMSRAMHDELAAAWTARVEDLPLSTPQEAVVLASVVEKETGLAVERPRVAGVFINRLSRGIPLQSDPTVIYVLTKGQGPLPRALMTRDLKIDSPYNTYVVRGLPPAPIANPGRASLNAVLHPEKNDFIYFVADGTGGHVFASTLKEHNNNVARWRRLQKSAKPG